MNGKTYNLEFWFDSGSLDGEELITQFCQVLMRCENVGARLLGMVCDTGGNNARFYKLLSPLFDLPEGGWLPTDNVRTVNPWDRSDTSITFSVQRMT